VPHCAGYKKPIRRAPSIVFWVRVVMVVVAFLPILLISITAIIIIMVFLASRSIRSRNKSLLPPPPPQMQQQTIREVVRKEVIVKVRCSYCGAQFDETLDKCPNCGAAH
jgi:transposase